MFESDPLESISSLRETVVRLRRLVELSATLNSTLNLDALLKLIIQTAADILESEAASILLFDEKTNFLFFATAAGKDAKKLAEIPVPIDNSIAGTIFRTQEPLILNRIDNDPRHNAKASEHVGLQVESLLGVPLQIRDKTIGVLESLNKKKGAFNDADKDLLSIVASHAAIAINNAQLIQALKKSYKEISEADQLKTNFLTLASHELRTPLGIIIGYATFLREGTEEKTSAHAEQVLNAALRMRTLLKDMHNLTMLESESQPSASTQHVILQEVLKIATKEIYTLAQDKGQRIVFEFQEEPLELAVNLEKFNAAIGYLLHNAVRFSPEKETIIIGAKRDGNSILCWVKDNGIGIPRDQLESIFEKFHQVESPDIRRYGGMGIGLSIALGLIESQGGKLWAESEGEGQGAIFKISFEQNG